MNGKLFLNSIRAYSAQHFFLTQCYNYRFLWLNLWEKLSVSRDQSCPKPSLESCEVSYGGKMVEDILKGPTLSIGSVPL